MKRVWDVFILTRVQCKKKKKQLRKKKKTGCKRGQLQQETKCRIPPSRWAPQPVTQQAMPAGKTWEEDGRQMGWMVLVNSNGSLSSSSAMS